MPRMASRRPFYYLLACLAPGLATASLPAMAQAGSAESETTAAARRIISFERYSSDLLPNLEYLCDMIGPRLTGSAALKRANDWTAEKMREYGLDSVHLESYTIPAGWERGTVDVKIVSPTELPISAAQMAWTPGTHGRITGKVVLFTPEKEEDFAAYRGTLRNAIVMTSRVTARPGPEGILSLPGSKALPAIPAISAPAAPAPTVARPAGGAPPDFKKMMEFRRKVNGFLRKEGVAAVLRSADKPHMLLNMTGSWTAPGFPPAYPTLFVAQEHLMLLQRLLDRKVPVTMEVKATARFVHGPVTVYNTVGEIKGSEKPDEVVLLGAHLDSWDLGTGATDNGTGTVAVLEAARVLKAVGAAPKRTIRFVLFTGEEQGLIGSAAYVSAHKAEMPNYDVVFVHDTGTGRVKGLWMQNRAEAKPELSRQFDVLKQLGLLTDEANLIPGKMNGTDHASFDDAGVPAFAFNQDGAEYGMTHHSQSDTFDKVRPDDLKQGACVLAILAFDAAQNPERYPRSAPVSTGK